ncbi:MAG: UDP-N-acetylglucosamine 1-carboxyvinyltransferase [Candidatus Moraniibacteriota bacterium]|nr:MAG: UDP-N-acetylglucosamine 1-carboxyvinyltransferase [Candidatus Moranbacteria bacterium]
MEYFKIRGGKKLTGSIVVNGSKNATVAVLAASVMNQGKTIVKNVPQIEEVNRWIEVLESIGMDITREEDTLILIAPKKFTLEKINKKAAKKTRSAIMLISALAGRHKKYFIPQAGGCKLGARTIKPHLFALEKYGIDITPKKDGFEIEIDNLQPVKNNVLYESGDTVTETAIMAAAQIPGKTTIKMATANYMVQDLCFYLEGLGVKIKGIGTTTLEVYGKKKLKKNIEHTISEDPIEAMFFVSLAITTKSELIIKRCPIDFLELELLKLEKMGQKYEILRSYKSQNKKTRLVDIKMIPSKLMALEDKIHALPFPGLNMDNLPFFVPIAMMAKGTTLIHDWVFENRAVYFTELNRLGGNVALIDSHRIEVTGPSQLKNADLTSPPALRPAAIMLVGMLGAKGESILRDVYSINRGYENLENRLRSIGADIELVKE